MAITVRSAVFEDFEVIGPMITALAIFERMPDPVEPKIENLIRDGEFQSKDKSKTPLVFCYVAEIECEASGTTHDDNNKPLTRKIVGYTITYFKYSTWKGRTYFLEDLYVDPKYHKVGAGRALITNAAKLAREANCDRIEFFVLYWNENARKFYERLGATNLTETAEWQFYRFNQKALGTLTSK